MVNVFESAVEGSTRIAPERRSLKSNLFVGSIVVICFSLLCGCVAPVSEPVNSELLKSPLFSYFEAEYPDVPVVFLIKGDCNDDGIDDLIIVYRADANHNHKVTVYSNEDGFRLSEPRPAPFQDVLLEFKNIDDIDQYELVVSGRRGAAHGLGVLRFVDGEWIDLFGGLEDCC